MHVPDFAPGIELARRHLVTGIVSFVKGKELRLGELEEAGTVAGLHIRLDPGGNPGSGRFDVQAVADHFANNLAQFVAVAKPERVRFTDGLPDGTIAGRGTFS